MVRDEVVSSNIESIGYEDGTLEVEFRSGAVYRYRRVPADKYQALMSAGSVGSFFSRQIRGVYQCEQVDED